MPIVKRKKVMAAEKSTSTHGGNGEPVSIEEQSDTDLENNMSVDKLMDPEDFTGGSTHTSVLAASTTKSVTAKGKGKVKASETTNVGTIDQDIDPASGYLENAGELDDDEDEISDEEIAAAFGGPGEDATLENNNAPQEIEAADGEDDDWDPAPEGDEGEDDDTAEVDFDAPADIETDAEGDIEDEAEMEDEGDVVVEEPEDKAPKGEALAIVDIDETADDDIDGVNFAAAGTRLLVIKANRVIATMTAAMAKKTDRTSVYLSDQFQQVTAMEMTNKGLRKGLKSMGFALATVDVTASHVVNARVKTEANKLTAAVRKVHATKQEALNQSLTIAAVGLNRKMFKEENPLKAHIEQELTQAGVTGAGKMLHKAFASHGPLYAKQIIELAQKIAAMPQEMRDSYVTALDLTSEDMDVPTDDVVPVGSDDMGMENDEDIGDFEDVSVASTLATAGVARRNKVVANTGHYSVGAMAILNGDQPLFTL
jgi:hypothetical protein